MFCVECEMQKQSVSCFRHSWKLDSHMLSSTMFIGRLAALGFSKPQLNRHHLWKTIMQFITIIFKNLISLLQRHMPRSISLVWKLGVLKINHISLPFPPLPLSTSFTFPLPPYPPLLALEVHVLCLSLWYHWYVSVSVCDKMFINTAL